MVGREGGWERAAEVEPLRGWYGDRYWRGRPLHTRDDGSEHRPFIICLFPSALFLPIRHSRAGWYIYLQYFSCALPLLRLLAVLPAPPPPLDPFDVLREHISAFKKHPPPPRVDVHYSSRLSFW